VAPSFLGDFWCNIAFPASCAVRLLVQKRELHRKDAYYSGFGARPAQGAIYVQGPSEPTQYRPIIAAWIMPILRFPVALPNPWRVAAPAPAKQVSLDRALPWQRLEPPRFLQAVAPQLSVGVPRHLYASSPFPLNSESALSRFSDLPTTLRRSELYVALDAICP
jgi:hypothetical protein